MDSRIEPTLVAHRQVARQITAYEPAIAEMLADPVVRQVMNRDGVSREALISLLQNAQAMRQARLANGA